MVLKKTAFVALLLAAFLFAAFTPAQAQFAAGAVIGPSTFAFTAGSQSHVWSCNSGQSTFQLNVPAGATATFTVTVGQTSTGTFVNPPWAYAPGVATYTNTITNSGSLTVNLGSNLYVKVADTSYSSGSATVSGVCSSAVAYVLPQPQATPSPTAGSNMVITGSFPYSFAVAGAPTFSGTVSAASFTGSGAGLTSGTVPNAALVTLPVTSVACSSNIVCSTSTGPTPTITLSNTPGVTTLTAAGTIKSQPAANTNATFQGTATGSGIAIMSLDTLGASAINLNNDNTGIPTLTSVGVISGKTPSGNCGGATIGIINFITVGNTSHPGGGITFHTSDDSGSCVDDEPMVLTHDHHIYEPWDTKYFQFNSPNTCAALVPCMTMTWTFGHAFHNTAGGLNQPVCPGGMMRDDNNATVAWNVSIATAAGSISGTSVTYQFTPLTAISTATTVEFWPECHPSSY